jgi:aquaporin Z
MLKSRLLWVRLIVSSRHPLLVAAGGVINHSVGGCSISRTAVVISPGALVMALIYA